MANARHSLRTGIVTQHGGNTEEMLMRFGLGRDESGALTASGGINAYGWAARLSPIKQKNWAPGHWPDAQAFMPAVPERLS